MKQMTKHNIYITPDGFLDSFDDRVLSADALSRRPRMALISKISLAAAMLVCAVTAGIAYRLSTPDVDDRQVFRAFCNLSEDDRDYLLDYYQNDIFLNL